MSLNRRGVEFLNKLSQSASDGGSINGDGNDITLGRVKKLNSVCIFGQNSVIPTSENILSPSAPVNSLYITFPVSATTIKVASTSANDTSAGTGCRSVLIIGLDSNYQQIVDIIAMNGQTAVTSTNSFLRINSLFCLTAGSGGVNEGNIHIAPSSDTFTGGEPNTTLYFTLGADDGIAKSCVFTTRANQGLIFNTFTITTDAQDGKEIHIFGRLRQPNSVTTKPIDFLINNGVTQFTGENLLAVPEKTDVWITAERKGVSIEASILVCGSSFDYNDFPDAQFVPV